MKILFITGSLNQGGAEFQILALAKLFKEKGHDASVFAVTDYTFFLDYVNTNKIMYSHLLNTQSRLKRIFLTKKHIENLKPEIVISYLKEPSIVAMLCKATAKVKFKLLISERTSLILGWYDRFYFNLALIADRITVNSVSKHSYINKKFPLLKKKTFFVPNIIDLDKYLPISNQKVITQVCSIAFVGRISPEKNLLNLVKALGILKEKGYLFSFNLYGNPVNKSYFDELMVLIQGLKLTDCIHYKGPVKEVSEVYKITDLLCLVSMYEGFSNVIAEAIASGIPVVASNIAENQFLVKERVNGFLVDQLKYDSIAKGIEDFLMLPASEKKALGLAAQQLAREIFETDQIYSRYLEILK